MFQTIQVNFLPRTSQAASNTVNSDSSASSIPVSVASQPIQAANAVQNQTPQTHVAPPVVPSDNAIQLSQKEVRFHIYVRTTAAA